MGEKRLKNPGKRVRDHFSMVFGPFWQVFLALDFTTTKKVFEHFLIDILCCLKSQNKISKIEKKHTVPL